MAETVKPKLKFFKYGEISKGEKDFCDVLCGACFYNICTVWYDEVNNMWGCGEDTPEHRYAYCSCCGSRIDWSALE